MSVTQFTRITPSAQGTDPCLEDSTGHQSQARLQDRPAVEICFLFGKTIKLLLSDRVRVISFPGFGYFFLNCELFPIVRLPIYILLHLIHI